jgi:hypothetical protein
MTTSTADGVERLYSFGQIADLWQVSRDHVRKVFLGRRGIINVGMQGKASWRVPASVLKEEMLARGAYQKPEDLPEAEL